MISDTVDISELESDLMGLPYPVAKEKLQTMQLYWNLTVIYSDSDRYNISDEKNISTDFKSLKLRVVSIGQSGNYLKKGNNFSTSHSDQCVDSTVTTTLTADHVALNVTLVEEM